MSDLQSGRTVYAPWGQDLVDELNEQQRHRRFHPYTCGVSSTHGEGYLVATVNGWICPACSYAQGWVTIR